MSSAARVFSGYRRLFRARSKLFVGDVRAIAESRIAIRTEFDKNRTVTDPAKMEGLFVMIDEAEDMILNGIVQGKRNDDSGNYEIKVKAEHTEGGDNPTMEPITADTAGRLSGEAPKVEVTKNNPKN